MEIGTTARIQIIEIRDGYLKGSYEGEHYSIAGDGTVGETKTVRVLKHHGDVNICVTEGAEIRLRVDEMVDASTVRADPTYGPVFITEPLSVGDWWRCRVSGVKEDRIVAEPVRKIPRESKIPEGPRLKII